METLSSDICQLTEERSKNKKSQNVELKDVDQIRREC
jgi:hypothetical protein